MNDRHEPAAAPETQPHDDEAISSDDEMLDERDKALADSFPASDPPAMP